LAVAAALLTLASVSARAGAPAAFTSRCAVCHQADGRGVPGIYPPLADTIGAYLGVKGGREYLLHVVLNGFAGSLETGGVLYYGLMPPANDLSDADIAAALNYVLRDLNARELPRGFAPYTAAEVKSGRAAHPGVTGTAEERAAILQKLRMRGGGSEAGR
jgi:mono/diheme cytochrome c family protein